MGQKLTSERDSSNKCCYICKSTEESLLHCTSCGRYCDTVCAWLEDQEVSSTETPTDWQCPDCKTGTQFSDDMDVDSSSVSSFDSVLKSRSNGKASIKKASTPPPSKTSDKATKRSEMTPKANAKRLFDTARPPSPPLVVIKSSKKKSESESPTKRQKKSSKSTKTQQKEASTPSKAPQQDMATQTLGASEMQLSSSNQPDELQTALHTIQTHLDHVHLLRTRNAELTEEVKTLKERANTGEETSWELKEYNENLEAQVKELKAERDELAEKLQKIRRLSGIARLDTDDA
ncbi:hypothetical protein DPV78_012284 [Talaromyces pinophilus]|nr:hypothetical protein DPV78_012284 [Talaromyces pinophilus]